MKKYINGVCKCGHRYSSHGIDGKGGYGCFPRKKKCRCKAFRNRKMY